MLLSAVTHLFAPGFTAPFVPDFLPKKVVHVGTALVETVLAMGILWGVHYRTLALQGTIVLLVVLLSVHLRDLFLENPAIGSRLLAWIRIPFQFLFMGVAWYAMY